MKYFAATVVVIIGAVIGLSLAKKGRHRHRSSSEDMEQDSEEMFQNKHAFENFERQVSNTPQPMPEGMRGPGDQPEHGPCYKTYRSCANPGESLPYDGNEPCFFCKCGRNKRKFCCRAKPRPIVRNPHSCQVRLDTDKCVYKRSHKCKKACKVIGWYNWRHYRTGWN